MSWTKVCNGEEHIRVAAEGHTYLDRRNVYGELMTRPMRRTHHQLLHAFDNHNMLNFRNN